MKYKVLSYVFLRRISTRILNAKGKYLCLPTPLRSITSPSPNTPSLGEGARTATPPSYLTSQLQHILWLLLQLQVQQWKGSSAKWSILETIGESGLKESLSLEVRFDGTYQRLRLMHYSCKRMVYLHVYIFYWGVWDVLYYIFTSYHGSVAWYSPKSIVIVDIRKTLYFLYFLVFFRPPNPKNTKLYFCPGLLFMQEDGIFTCLHLLLGCVGCPLLHIYILSWFCSLV